MSREDAYYWPTTPPGVGVPVPRLHPLGSAHSRHTSGSSIHSHDSSPDSVMTSITSPSATSPTHQHGPQLLPKIRTQDVDLEPAPTGSSTVGPRRHRRVLSNSRNPPGYMPYPSNRPSTLSRNVLDTSDCGSAVAGGLISPVSPAAVSSSGLSSPIILTSASGKRKSLAPGHGGHSRSTSTSSIDDVTLTRYGYPTYRKLPKYVSQAEASPVSPVDAASFVFPAPYGQVPPMRVPCPIQLPTQQQQHAAYYGPAAAMPSPQYDYLRVVQSAQPSPVGFLAPPLPSPSPPPTSLLAHLTNTTPPVNLVRTVNYGPTRGLQDYFWWDIRQLRPWSTFSLTTFNEISGLTQLLKTPIHRKLPQPLIDPSRLTPESENSLINLIGDIYGPRVNAATRVSQGPDHMRLYVSPEATSSGGRSANGAHFLGNYASDTDVITASGNRRARVVGIAKSFDRWNTGMRNERPHRRVEYLRGLAHLQRCMREHSCRYGFIITEIEMICVRAGCDDGDDVPYFGYLEVSAPIATKEAAPGIIFEKTKNQNQNGESIQEQDQDHRSSRSNTPHLSADDNLSYGSGSSASSVSSTSSPPLPPQQHQPTSPISSSPKPTSPTTSSVPDDGIIRVTNGLDGVPLTATMALYFLLMLSKSMPLPTQPSGHLNVGGPGSLSRQRILSDSKDKWIPEPQLGEKRDAKRVRGWIWPTDAWHRREGTRPKNGNPTTTTNTKKGRSSKTVS